MCSYLQKIGVANISIGISLMLHAPSCFKPICIRLFGEMLFLTSCYLLYKMPLYSIDYKFLFSCFILTPPLFHLPPKVFGCVWFVHIIIPNPTSANSTGGSAGDTADDVANADLSRLVDQQPTEPCVTYKRH